MSANPNTVAVLSRARAILASPKSWTKHNYAVDKQGHRVDPADAQACRWCAEGAVICAAKEIDPTAFHAAVVALDEAVKVRTHGDALGTSIFNDWPSTTHTHVIAAFDAAISKLEQGF